MIKGRVRMHTLDGHQDFAAGEAFYWGAGHAPEALEDSEYVDFSPTDECRRVLAHLTSRATSCSKTASWAAALSAWREQAPSACTGCWSYERG
jgi:hypothetical protein